ncbi:MAG TPA: hypothetical protein VGM98_21045 [Schlesneria sp.]|jgi:hypothetical protein
MRQDDDNSRMLRRDFARQIVLGAGLSAVPLTAAPAASSDVPPAPKLPEDPAPIGAEAPPPPEVLLLTYLVRRYPNEHFDDVAIQGIFRDIRGDVARGRALAEFPLKNSDEPAFVYSAYRAAVVTPPKS